MRKIVSILMFLLFICSFYNVYAYSPEEYCEFSNNKKILFVKTIYDLSTNTFKLYELEGGYAIYALKENNEYFLEGSYQHNSPYFEYREEKLIYLGVGEYYIKQGNKVISILDNNKELTSQDVSYDVFENYKGSLQSDSFPNLDMTTTNSDDFIVIISHKYFENLKTFPYNSKGECGIIALSILLGYYDTFWNDEFIKPGFCYDSRNKYNSTIPLMLEKTLEIISPLSDYGYKSWGDMPGTSYGMRDYLLDKYNHQFMGGGDIWGGNPMADEELKATMSDYINDNCSNLKSYVSVSSGSLFFTHSGPKSCINEGYPTCLVLTSYSYGNGEKGGKPHVVVAYGYKDDKFLVHMGWDPGTLNYSSIVLSDLTIYGYYCLKYTGPHIHSRNMKIKLEKNIKYACSCGHTYNEHTHDFSYTYNDENTHLSSCPCGFTELDAHNWVILLGDRAIPEKAKFQCTICNAILMK